VDTRTKVLVAVAAIGLLIAIPTGLDDLLVNLPLGLGLAELFGLKPAAGVAVTYVLGALIAGAALFFLSKTIRRRLLGKYDF